MRLFIWCNCVMAVTHVCVSHPFCAIAMCDCNMFLYRSQSHSVNNFTKSHEKNAVAFRKNLPV